MMHVYSLNVSRSSHAHNKTCSFSTVEPPLDFQPHQFCQVLVPVSGTISFQLKCDIEPGAGRVVQWNRLNSDNTSTLITEGISQDSFNLTLMVNINSNNSVYMCTVTIDYCGNLTRSYNGPRITLRTAG